MNPTPRHERPVLRAVAATNRPPGCSTLTSVGIWASWWPQSGAASSRAARTSGLMRSMAAASSLCDHGVEFDTVEATRVLTNGGVAPLGHSGECPARQRRSASRAAAGPRSITRESSEVDASSTHSRGLCGPAVSGMMLSRIPTPPNSPRSPVVSTLPYGSPVSPSAAADPDDRSSPALRSNAAWSRAAAPRRRRALD